MKKVIKDVTKVITKFSEVLDFARDKISNAAAVIPLMVKGGEKIAAVVSNIREKKSKPSKTKKKTK